MVRRLDGLMSLMQSLVATASSAFVLKQVRAQSLLELGEELVN